MKLDKVLLLTLVGILSTLALFMLLLLLPPGIEAKDFYQTYGTFYGGVFGPVATALGFYFLYRAYQNQRSEADFTLLNKPYADLLDDIASMHYRAKSTGIASLFGRGDVYQGIDALYNFGMGDGSNSVLNHLNLIIRSFEYLIERIRKSDYKDEATKAILLKKVYLLYYAKIVWPVFYGVYRHKDELFIKGWSNPREFFFAFERLTKETVRYLAEQKIIEEPLTRKPHPEPLIVSILTTDYSSLDVWAHSAYAGAQNNFIPPVPLRTKIGKGLSWFLPNKVVELIKVNTRYPIFGVS